MVSQKKNIEKAFTRWKNNRVSQRHKINKSLKPIPYKLIFIEELQGKLLFIDIDQSYSSDAIPLFFFKNMNYPGLYKKRLQAPENAMATGKMMVSNFTDKEKDKGHRFIEVLSSAGVAFVKIENVVEIQDSV